MCLIAILFIASVVLKPQKTNASAMYQRCTPSTDCTLGEYVFDNNGDPVTTQICTIDIRDPDGDLIVDDAAMTADGYGWHYYTANIASPEGLYRALVYCDNSGDTGYLEKTFILGTDIGSLATSSEITSAVTSIKTLNDYDLGDIIGYVDTLETNVGTSSDTSSSNTVFGKIAAVQESVDQITTIDTNIDALVAKWGSYSATDIYDKVKNLSSDISAINTVSNVSSILTLAQSNATDSDELMNKVLAMKAVLDVNRILLEKSVNAPVIKTWLEQGSIIFKTLVTNPSSVTSQTVPLKYYLPREVKREDIIKLDDGLEVEYDPTEEAYFVHGEFTLETEGTKILSVEVADIWIIEESEIESLRKQAVQLAKPLKGTSYFAQGSTLVSDIEASCDRAIEYQRSVQTPQAKIRAFREAKIEIESAKRKIDDLKSLASSAGSAGSFLGFVGGVQTVSMWGIVILFVGGFVIMVSFIRTGNPRILAKVKLKPKIALTGAAKIINKNTRRFKYIGLALIILFLLGLLIAFVASRRNVGGTGSDEPEQKEPSPTPTIVEKKKTVRIIETGVGYLNVRSGPSTKDDVITKASVGDIFEEVERIDIEDEVWIKIILEGGDEGWVISDYVQEEAEYEADEIEVEGEKSVLGTDTNE